MVVASMSLREDYWSTLVLENEDIEFLYNHLLELEIPQTSQELAVSWVNERLQREKQAIETQRSSGGTIYYPKDSFVQGDKLIFPALNWLHGEVVQVRPGHNPDLGPFEVIRVTLQNGETKEYAANLATHTLNEPMQIVQDDDTFNPEIVLKNYGEDIVDILETGLTENEDFVRVAGRWFPRALLVDINAGNLNLAEAVLDMAGGGPMITQDLLQQVEIHSNVNPKLVEFSLDLALWEDSRFDEVGPSGSVVWFLNRLEPEGVRQTPQWLRYPEVEYDRSLLTPDMLALERELDDELTPAVGTFPAEDEVQIHLIYPHLRAGTLPLSARVRPLFPTAFEAPRVRVNLIDADTGQTFPGWVIRQHRYVYGLEEWYQQRGLIPGSPVRIRRGDNPGEVILHAETHHPNREWVRTVLVGSDGGTVFAMLKQIVPAGIDERMTVAVPDVNALDQVWTQIQKERVPFERIVVNTVRELAKLNPQSHVHASELYAAVNIVRRCPPGPILALLASRPWFVHVGDLHFRFDDSER